MEKIVNHKSFNYFVGHLWEVVLTYRYIFAFKFTLRYQQPDIVPIICPVSTTIAKLVDLPPVPLIPVANLPPVLLIPVVHLDLRISPRIFEKFKTVLLGYSGAGGKLIHEKKQKQKIS